MHRTATRCHSPQASVWLQPLPPPTRALAMYALSAGEWDTLSYATQYELMIAQRAHFLWEAGEPGTDKDRWALAERIQQNGGVYDLVYSAVAKVLATALPPGARINRQTLVAAEVVDLATERGVKAVCPQELTINVNPQTLGKTLGKLVDLIVTVVTAR